MKFQTLQISLLFFIAFLLPGCKKSYVFSDQQKILFQQDYINYAWGFQHYGYLIDFNGKVLIYNNPAGWNFTDAEQNISQDHMNENIAKCRESGIIISSDDLEKYSNYIPNIASSKVTSPRNVGADMGSSTFTCYLFNENTKSYKSYLIKMTGDYTSENLNFYSRRVVSWMQEINDRIARVK